jgi:hypothetical protein
LVADLHEGLGDVVDVLDVHPAGHIGHGAAGAGGREEKDRQQLGTQELPVVGVLGLVAADVGGVGEHAADAAGVGVGGAVGEGGPAGAGDAGQAEGVVDPDGAEVGPVGAGGSEDVGFDGGGDQVALPLQDGRDDQPVGLERPGWPKGQDRVALLHGQVEAAEESILDSVAAAQDDSAPPRPQHYKVAELPEAGPLGAALLALAAGPWRQQPHQQPVGQSWDPEGEDGGGVHAHRPWQQRPGVRWPGSGRVIPSAGQPQQDAEHVDQPHL